MHNIKIISTSNLFGTQANPIQIMKMADAFSDIGFNVEILVPGWKKSINSTELSGRYGVKNNFKINFIPNISIKGKLAIITFTIGSFLKSFNWNDRAIIITRNERIAAFLVRAGKKVIYENHTFYYPSEHITLKYRQRVKSLMKNKNICMIAVSKRLKELWGNCGIDSDKIFVAHDGVDLAEFKKIAKLNKRELRKKLGLPLEKEIICYAGSLSKGRGIEFILDAATFYKDKNYLFLIIGGRNLEINKYKNKLSSNNAVFTGYIENSKVPLYLRCADLLVMPYQSKVVTIDGCSPLKVFEYLASGGYILGPIFPSFYEIMKDFEGITLYESEDNRKFIVEIDKILSNPNSLRFHDRLDKLDIYSWQNRAKKLLNIYFQFFELDIPPIIRERFN